MNSLFQSLTQEMKVDFFVKYQQLMLKHHPNSHFIIREDSLKKTLETCANNIKKYQGYSYLDENACILWNHIIVTDPQDINKVVMDNAYKPPNPDFNGVSIDFAVFRKIEDCLEFIKNNNNNKIKYVLFIRDGHPKIYQIDVLLKGIGASALAAIH